jgi:hypothetical protein
MHYDEILRQVENKIGTQPRKFNLVDKLTWLKQDKPEWDWEDDEIKHSVENWHKVFTKGKIAWGHIIQVNNFMFEKSDSNCPGEVLIWLEKSKPFNPDAFELVAEKLYEIKGYSQYLDDSDEKEFAEYLENQLIRAYGVKVPSRISDGLNLRVSTVFFQRRHIPNGVITNSLFPVLYLDESPMVAAMVPCKFWPQELLRGWQ